MPKVTRTVLHTLCTRLALEVAVNCAEPAVTQPSNFRSLRALLHRLGILNLSDREAFDLIWW